MINIRRVFVTLSTILALSSMDAHAFSLKNLKMPGFRETSFRRVIGEPVKHQTNEIPAGKFICTINNFIKINIYWSWGKYNNYNSYKGISNFL